MVPKLFDIHSHLNLSDFDQDWPEVLGRTLAGDCWTITVGADLASSKKAVEIANSKPEGVWATVGFHPTEIPTPKPGAEAGAIDDDSWNELAELAKDKKVVAVGECGLEYYRIVKSEELKVKSNQKEL
ncbi:MAG: TatD family hydrolase, partial [Candidatus Vogelbacteria bacterium]|nr:TatD family hydrolase [Candidatus Vogelbacteria bacterium]